MSEKNQAIEHDEHDYDGMGNHGRFPPPPPVDENKRVNISDLILIAGAFGLIITYFIIRV